MMNAEDNKRAAMATWKAFASRDPAEIAAMFTEDAEWFAPPGNATAAALNSTKHLMGKADIVQFISVDFGTLFAQDVKLDFKGFYGDGDVVVVEQRFRATLASGAPLRQRLLLRHRIAGRPDPADARIYGHRQGLSDDFRGGVRPEPAGPSLRSIFYFQQRP